MDLRDVAVDLYGLDPGEFTAARKERAAAARAAGDRELADAVTALRKPTVAAWTVNLLARSASEEVSALLALGEALRTAQRELSGPKLRALTAQRGQVVSALARQAGELAAEQGRPVGEPVLREVGNTLTAALADPEVAEKVRLGTLASATSYEGFGPTGADLAVVPDHAAPQRDRTPKKSRPTARDRAAARAERAAERQRAAREQLDAARAELESAESARESAARDAATAADLVRDNAARVGELRAELAAAEERHRFSRTAEKAAGEALRAAETDAERARRRAEKAQAALADLEE